MKYIGYISTSFNHKFNHMIQMCNSDLRLKLLIEILQKLKQRNKSLPQSKIISAPHYFQHASVYWEGQEIKVLILE